MTPTKLITFLILASLTLLCAPVFADCNDLTVELKVKDREILRGITCKHGLVKSNHARRVTLTNAGLYGPDCRLAIADLQGNIKATFAVQQNYCALKAGSITVTPQNGEIPVYKKTEGSYWDGRGGLVVITGFRPDSSSKAR